MKSSKTEIKWSIIFCITILLWNILLALLGYTTDKIGKFPIVDSLFVIVALLIYIMALRQKRQQLGHQIKWIQGFLSGLKITILIAILSIPCQFITHYAIMPHFFENSINYAIANNKMTLESAKAYFNLKNYVIQSSLGALGFGFVISCVVAALMYRKPKLN